MVLQWNLNKPVTIGPKNVGCNIEVASISKCWRCGLKKDYSCKAVYLSVVLYTGVEKPQGALTNMN